MGRRQIICRSSILHGKFGKATVCCVDPSLSDGFLHYAGLTETCTVVSSSPVDDIWFGSSGSLLPSVEVRIISPDGKEITEYDQPGEIVVRSPSIVLGYLNNKAANRESFRDGWMYTGDEGLIKIGPRGTEHIWVVDRIKELIKVKVRFPNQQS